MKNFLPCTVEEGRTTADKVVLTYFHPAQPICQCHASLYAHLAMHGENDLFLDLRKFILASQEHLCIMGHPVLPEGQASLNLSKQLL